MNISGMAVDFTASVISDNWSVRKRDFLYIGLDMVHTLKRADVVAVEDDLAFQLVPVLLDVVVLHHDDHHIHLAEELVEVKNLVLDNLLLGKERIKCLQRTG